MKVKNRLIASYLMPDKLDRGRGGMSKDDLKASFLENLFYRIGKMPGIATTNDLYAALALSIRTRVFSQFVKSTAQFAKQDVRALAFFSAEYLPGPHLANNLLNLNITEATREAVQELGLELEEILEQEVEPGLGNGGLGRLASCYMDSLATLGIPSIGYGIRYEFGIFTQTIRNGWQVEVTDKWLHFGNPWEVVRPEIAYEVKFGGKTHHPSGEQEQHRVKWIPDFEVKGTAYDTPILGYRSNGIIMRLWRAEAIESFDFEAFNLGDYYKAVEAKMLSENITKVLYPNDAIQSGKELRLKQQYFFVSCSLQDIISIHLGQGRSLDKFHEKFTVQLNDTHPSIAVAELMRLLVDEHQLEWEEAWYITRHTFAYTNHTLLPEALEKWSVNLLGRILPRHLEIIYEINKRFLHELRSRNYSGEQISRMSLIDETGDPCVRMAHLATLGSYKVNGVSELHSELLKKQVLSDFAGLSPKKFTNVTNGITPRRFLVVSNPGLTRLIKDKIGSEFITDLEKLRALESWAEDRDFQQKWMQVKFQNKKALAEYIQEKMDIKLDPKMLFDVQVKRIHEYKRQHLKVLHILSLYLLLKKGKGSDIPHCAFIFAGKAAPGYKRAKLIIKLIHAVADLVNSDEEVNDRMKVVFLPNFSVKQAQRIYPAADLSEQISLAGKEASGTGNMKFALNGALLVGTLDGANIEIREEVGRENFFLFGLTAEEVQRAKAEGYQPYRKYEENPQLREVMDFLVSPELSPEDPELFRPIFNNLLEQDPYMLLQDFQSYVECHQRIHEVWEKPEVWAKRSILNVANMGKFSSDRAVRDYCENIWKICPLKLEGHPITDNDSLTY
ncbi:MAG: glycogen/starch/alpha-glucan phosphorylase [Salegentibacter sp.]